MLLRALKTRLKSLAYSSFIFFQRFKLNVLPLHFYSNIPDIRNLKQRTDWLEPRSMIGLGHLPVPEQVSLLESFIRDGAAALQGRDVYAEAVAMNGDEGYGVVEADVLAAYIAALRPKKIVQIGAGVSTAIIIKAAQISGYEPDITCVDPYPTPYLIALAGNGKLTLLAEPAQTVPLDALTALEVGDLLFVDSTHTVKAGSEVNRIVFEVLPRLKSGVRVHFHDIYFPYDYSRSTLTSDLLFQVECALLYAYLCDNPRFSIELCMSMLHYAAPNEIKRLIPKYEPQSDHFGLSAPGGRHFPSSIFLTRTSAV